MPKDNASNEQRIVDFFQDIADEGEEADIYKLAKENNIRDPDKVLTELAGIAGADFRNHGIANFPVKTLEYYNRGLPETGDLLNAHDIELLQPVIERYGDKLKRQYEQKQQQGYSRMAETFGGPPPPAQTPQTPPPYSYQTQGGIVLPQADPRADAEGELLRSFLSANYNPRPHLIPSFIDQQFKPYYDYFTQNPGALLQSLTHNFASAGKMAYDMWIANKSRVNMDPYAAQAQYGYTNPSMPPPSQIPFMSNPTMTTPQLQPKTQEEVIDEQRWARMEKMMNRNMQLKYMEMMGNFGGNGQQNNNMAQPPPGVAYTQEPLLDVHGRPTGQFRYIPVAVGNGDNEAFKILAQSLQAQVQTLLQNQQNPNMFLTELFKVVMPSIQSQNRDPFDSFGKVMEVSERLAQHKQPDTKPLEAISKEIDAKLALRQIESNEKREEREYRRELEGERMASENTKGYIDTIKEVVNTGIKPFAGGLLQQQQQMQQQQVQQQQAQAQQSQASEAEQMQMQAIREAQIRQQQQQQAIEQARVLQQEQKLRDAQAMANKRPTEEVIAERTDGQLEQDFSELDMQRRHLERIFQQVSAERAKRRMIRSGGIATRAQQQVVFATPPEEPEGPPSFADRVQEQQQQVAAGHTYSDNTRGTAGAVSTQMNEDDMEALRASKDGGGVAPMDFHVGGSPNAERQREIEQGLSTEPGFEEEEEYEDDEPEPEEGTPTKEE